MSSFPTFESWMPQYVTQSLPVLIGWLFATYFCFKRRWENPRGAALLGIAVLLQLTIFGSRFLFELINQEMNDPTFLFQWSGIYHGTTRFLTMASWILVAFAVFPGRRDHRDIHSALDDDTNGDESVIARNPS